MTRTPPPQKEKRSHMGAGGSSHGTLRGSLRRPIIEVDFRQLETIDTFAVRSTTVRQSRRQNGMPGQPGNYPLAETMKQLKAQVNQS